MGACASNRLIKNTKKEKVWTERKEEGKGEGMRKKTWTTTFILTFYVEYCQFTQ